jgi:hypothetical protein
LCADSPAKNLSAIKAGAQGTRELRRETAMRRLLGADDDPHIGQAIPIWFKHHGVRVAGDYDAPIYPAPLHAVIDAPTGIQADIQRSLEPPPIEASRRTPNHPTSGDNAMSSGGAASVNRGRLPAVAGQRYTPQLE